MHKSRKFHIVDPRRGEDWTTQFYDGSLFSSVDQQCIVVHTADRRYVFEQRLPDTVILECLRNTGHIGLFSIAACEHIEYYDTTRIPTNIQYDMIGNSIAGYFDLTLKNIEGILAAIRVKDQYCYELNLASCLPDTHLIDRDAKEDIEYSFLLRSIQDLGMLISFDYDNLELIIFIRVFDGCDDIIGRIMRNEEH